MYILGSPHSTSLMLFPSLLSPTSSLSIHIHLLYLPPTFFFLPSLSFFPSLFYTSCSTVPENGTGTGKSTSSNGSYHAYAIPTPSRFISATLPPLPSHCMTRLPTPFSQQQHYEFASTLEDSLRSHLYDLPNKAATMPLPYEVPMVRSGPTNIAQPSVAWCSMI